MGNVVLFWVVIYPDETWESLLVNTRREKEIWGWFTFSVSFGVQLKLNLKTECYLVWLVEVSNASLLSPSRLKASWGGLDLTYSSLGILLSFAQNLALCSYTVFVDWATNWLQYALRWRLSQPTTWLMRNDATDISCFSVAILSYLLEQLVSWSRPCSSHLMYFLTALLSLEKEDTRVLATGMSLGQ